MGCTEVRERLIKASHAARLHVGHDRVVLISYSMRQTLKWAFPVGGALNLIPFVHGAAAETREF